VIPVHQFIPSAVATILAKAPLSPEKVEFAWRAAVGASVNNVTTVELVGHVLQVKTRDAAWQREIEHAAGLIRNRLEALLGEGVVRGLDVSVGG
jgi:hypothetical protein